MTQVIFQENLEAGGKVWPVEAVVLYPNERDPVRGLRATGCLVVGLVSIGGAGTWDGIVLSGLLAALLA